MSKFFRFHDDIPKLDYEEDIPKIREYLEHEGELNCTDRQLLILWYRFSDSWDATYLTVSNETLKPFAEWLADYEGDV